VRKPHFSLSKKDKGNTCQQLHLANFVVPVKFSEMPWQMWEACLNCRFYNLGLTPSTSRTKNEWNDQTNGKASNAKQQTQSIKRKASNAKHQTQSIKRKASNAKHQTNAKHQKHEIRAYALINQNLRKTWKYYLSGQIKYVLHIDRTYGRSPQKTVYPFICISSVSTLPPILK